MKETWASREESNISVATELRNYKINFFLEEGKDPQVLCTCIMLTTFSVCGMRTEKLLTFSELHEMPFNS